MKFQFTIAKNVSWSYQLSVELAKRSSDCK